MPIPFTCPHCGHTTDVDDQYAGQTGPCSACGKSVTIPGVAGGATAVAPPRTSGKTVAVVVVAVMLVLAVPCGGILIAMLLPAVSVVRENARQANCQSQLRQLGLAMLSYHDVHRAKFPAAQSFDEQGRPKHSWRVRILPQLDHEELYHQYNFDEPWDSPGNLEVARQMPPVFRCPSNADAPDSGEPGMTHYMLVTGEGTMFEGNRVKGLKHLRDGPSNTVMIVESPTPVGWTQPEDLPIEDLDRLLDDQQTGNHPHIFHVVMFDGSCRKVPKAIDPEEFRAIVTPDGNERNPQWLESTASP